MSGGRLRVVFMGSSSASAECLRAILREDSLEVVGIVTQPDRPAGRGAVPSRQRHAEPGLRPACDAVSITLSAIRTAARAVMH